MVGSTHRSTKGPAISGAMQQWDLTRVARSSMADEVLRELRTAIVDGRLKPGEQLREVQLSNAFGTGRGVLREALRQLVQEGLVDHQPHRGIFVRSMPLQECLDVYRAREAIEAGAVRLALQSQLDLDLSDLRQALTRVGDAAGGSRQMSEQLIAADVDFHRELVSLAGNTRLVRTHETLMAETRILLRHHPVYPPSDYFDDHARLVEGLEHRDPKTPELVAAHLRLSARLISDELAKKASGATPRRSSADEDLPVKRTSRGR